MTTETMLDRRLRELMAELAAPGDQSAAIDNVISVTRALRPSRAGARCSRSARCVPIPS